MEQLLQVVQLCLPQLSPKDVSVIACTCKDLKFLRVTWEAHAKIHFDLDGSLSAICWLHKNIVSIRTLSLVLKFRPPTLMLGSLFADGRNLTQLELSGHLSAELPPLPSQLRRLNVTGCKHLLALPDLPPKLKQLSCELCPALEELSSNLSSSAVKDIYLSSCRSLTSLPALPDCLDDLQIEDCRSLTELPELPASLSSLQLDGCISPRQLPKLTHTALTYLDVTKCGLLREIPDLPATLDSLHLDGLLLITQLPTLSKKGYDMLSLCDLSLTELPDPLPPIDEFWCRGLPIERLPKIPACTVLRLEGCSQLQQLPDQLPQDLRELDLSDCVKLLQLPSQLPKSLKHLNCSGCSSLQQLPDLAGSRLQELRLKGCVQLAGVQVGGYKNLVVHVS